MSAMNSTPNPSTSRRDFIKTSGRIAAVSALAGVTIPHVFAAENNTIRSPSSAAADAAAARRTTPFPSRPAP